jgi:hypothetical protein
MVCIPCFIVPVLLILWRFIIWPLIRPLYIRWYSKTEDKKILNGKVEQLDKLGVDDSCPFGCPLPKKNQQIAHEKNVSESEEKKNT